MGPFSFRAGEEIVLDLDLDFKADTASLYPADWSVVVWGDKGTVSATHNKGLQSKSWPHIDRTSGTVSVAAQKAKAALLPKVQKCYLEEGPEMDAAWKEFAHEPYPWVAPEAGCGYSDSTSNSRLGCDATNTYTRTWACHNTAFNKKEVKVVKKWLIEKGL